MSFLRLLAILIRFVRYSVAYSNASFKLVDDGDKVKTIIMVYSAFHRTAVLTKKHFIVSVLALLNDSSFPYIVNPHQRISGRIVCTDTTDPARSQTTYKQQINLQNKSSKATELISELS
ncbi:hypothetical protein L596_002173 [Steinernema carpocapsae]|uniref:Secreted protein n=1 Tax=Steinernema carpocapsae TaxID=34508 RepID=A0A4V6I7B7_STECR|nr:hypothetical protein L596_002173 [Steinernema carpocapsae]